MIIYCDGGVRENIGGWGFYIEENPETIHTGFGYAGVTNSSNVAEAIAITKALEFALQREWKDIQIYLDSRNTILGMNSIDDWYANGWKGASGNQIKNVPIWENILRIKNEYIKQGRTVQFDWVKAHNDNHGNEEADKLATRGIYTSKNGYTEDTYETITKGKSSIKKEKVESFNPMNTGKMWYFKTNSPQVIEDGRTFYSTVSFSKHADDKNVYAGKNEPDNHYALVVCKKPIPEFEIIKTKLNDLNPLYRLPVLVDLMAVKSSKHWGEIAGSPDKYITLVGESLITTTGAHLGGVVRPPRQIYKLTDFFEHGYQLLKQYEEKNEKLQIIDITKMFVEQNSKGKREINKNFTQNEKTMIVKNVTLLNGHTVDVKLCVGIDMPDRNQISAIIKMDPMSDIKISLIIWGLSDRSYHCSTIIERENYIGSYYTSDANYRLIS